MQYTKERTALIKAKITAEGAETELQLTFESIVVFIFSSALRKNFIFILYTFFGICQ